MLLYTLDFVMSYRKTRQNINKIIADIEIYKYIYFLNSFL